MVLLPAASLLGCMGSGNDPPALVTSENAAKLQTRQWALKSISTDGSQAVMDMQANMTLVFGADGRVTGYGSVNRFNGAYSFSRDGKLSWPGPGFITTRKAGPPELMEKERAYLEALPKTDRAILQKHALQLENEGESTLLLFTEAGAP
ncbi:MAG TPA: META domain-containing protein [Burkholderiales bacterium]|nr:META domain-containing protein [Burkholderiales bacterium]